MTAALDPLATMAFNVASSPRTYAVLLGSGVSRPASIPTGWEVVTELVAEYATAHDPDTDDQHPDTIREDPELWWRDNVGGELGYSSLLERLADTPSARRDLMRRFIEPDSDGKEGSRQPTRAHQALARLVVDGWVDVIMTTNFDRLTEQALAQAGVQAQVVKSAADAEAMQPLNHDGVTVVKIHGDYLSPDTLNTADELAAYPKALDELLDEVFDRYGLIVSGWSGDWDPALVEAIRRAQSRRYPIYWDARSSKGDTAAQLLADRRGTRVPADDADQLFEELAERVAAIDRMGDAPITVDVAIARLKRYLPHPTRRIALHDLLDQYSTEFTSRMLADRAMSIESREPDVWLSHLETYRDHSLPVVRLLAHGVFHDSGEVHTHVWVRTIKRMMAVDAQPDGSWNDASRNMMRYPALMALHVVGLLTMLQRRESQFLDLHLLPTWQPHSPSDDPFPAVAALNRWAVLLPDAANWILAARRENGQKWYWPVTELLVDDTAHIVAEFVDDTMATQRKAAEAARDYRTALLQQDLNDAGMLNTNRAAADAHFNVDNHPDEAIAAFDNDLKRPGASLLWEQALHGDDMGQAREALHESLTKYQR